MESTEKNMSSEESFKIIQQMIHTAKEQYSDDSFLFLFWGWLVFAASLGHYCFAALGYEQAQLAWILMPLGGVFTMFYVKKQNNQRLVKSYLDQFTTQVVIAFGVCLAIILFNMNSLQINCYPMVLMVYGLWLFISGGILKFKPLVIGGIINWGLSLIAFHVTFDVQLLLLSVAVLLGYIIPGYLLRNRYLTQQRNNSNK